MFYRFQEDVAQKLLDPLTPPELWLRFHPGGRNTAKNMKEIKSISNQVRTGAKFVYLKNSL